MQNISQNAVTQGKHGAYNAVDISPYPDPYYYAPEDGIITSWGESGTCGLRLALSTSQRLHAFCHNESSFVKVGDIVKRGQRLAKMGYTGLTDPDDVPAGTHVHWVILENGKYIYPLSLIDELFIKLEPGVDDMIKPTEKEVRDAFKKHLKTIDPSVEQVLHFTSRDRYELLAYVLDAQTYFRGLDQKNVESLTTLLKAVQAGNGNTDKAKKLADEIQAVLDKNK